LRNVLNIIETLSKGLRSLNSSCAKYAPRLAAGSLPLGSVPSFILAAKYYVSSSFGNDFNDETSPSTL